MNLLKFVKDMSLNDRIILTRNMKYVKRGQVLSFDDRYTVESHMYQMCIIFLQMYNYNVFNITESDRNYILYLILTHDLAESIVGDIPYHTKEYVKYNEESIEGTIIKELAGMNESINPKSNNKYCNMIKDMLDSLEFLMSMKENIRIHGSNNLVQSTGNNVLQELAIKNSVESLNKMIDDLTKAQVIRTSRQFQDFIVNVLCKM